MFATDENIPIVNRTMELADCRDSWEFNAEYNCWCLEDVLYAANAPVPKFQRLSIFAPRAYMNPDGSVNPDGASGRYTAATAPVIFANNAAGYMQMPHTWLGGPRDFAKMYLDRGMVYVSCGCRGRESRDAKGIAAGKSPATLIDFKTALRFLRHNRASLPGNWSCVISTGWSAGGAMSSLLGLTGDHPDYDSYLREAGAFMDESDAVYASQIYCPIVDLEHADLAYEWMFGADATCEDSPAGPAETMTPFKAALSKKLAARYVNYVNGLGLRHPTTGEALMLNPDGRSGGFYDYLMRCLDDSAGKFLSRLAAGELPEKYGVEDYLRGNYTHLVPAPQPPAMHHAGPGVAVAKGEAERMPGLGELLSRPPKGVPFRGSEPPMIEAKGDDKRGWLEWDGRRAKIRDLDSYVLHHRRRMKPCTAFDKLEMDSGENHVFGSTEADYSHFDPEIGAAIAELKGEFPEECAKYAAAFDVAGDAALSERVALINPMRYIRPDGKAKQAKHFRVRVGASDADTSFSVSMALALALANAGHDVNYARVWDQPHTQADYPGEFLAWIEEICSE